MELPLFHNQPVLSYNIEAPPENFVFFPEMTVSHRIYCEFYRWVLRTKLYREMVCRQCYSPEFDEHTYYVNTDTGWRMMVNLLDADEAEPELIALRQFVIGNFYVSEQNFALLRLKY